MQYRNVVVDAEMEIRPLQLTATQMPGLELQILRGTEYQGHSRRTPKATVLKNTIEV